MTHGWSQVVQVARESVLGEESAATTEECRVLWLYCLRWFLPAVLFNGHVVFASPDVLFSLRALKEGRAMVTL